MPKIANTNLKQKFLSWVARLTNFPVIQSSAFVRSSKSPNDDAGNKPHAEHYCSGGYNEAFIFEHWASFGPRH